MSGRIENVSEITDNYPFELRVSLIEPTYFADILKIGELITIQEGSIILAEGVVS